MSARKLAAAAAALTVLVNAMTARAEEPPTAAEPATQTPLVLRAGPKAAEAAAPGPSHTAAWPIAFAGLVVGGAAWVWRSRKTSPRATSDLAVLKRLSIGLRSELLVVQVEGQRMLIGVTPQSVQSLAMLDAEEPEPGPYAAAARPITERLDALLELDPRPSPSPRARAAEPEAPRLVSAIVGDGDLGQARGLAALRKRR